MAYRRRNRAAADDKYLRLTGLWQSKKKDNLWSGKLRAQDIEKLQEKIDEAVKADVDLMFFLWENDKRNNKDPDFTLQVCVAEEDQNGRRSQGPSRRSSGRDREDRSEREDTRDKKRDDDRDTEKDDEEDEDETHDTPEENPRKGRKAEPEPAPRGKRSGSTSKKDSNDW